MQSPATLVHLGNGVEVWISQEKNGSLSLSLVAADHAQELATVSVVPKPFPQAAAADPATLLRSLRDFDFSAGVHLRVDRQRVPWEVALDILDALKRGYRDG